MTSPQPLFITPNSIIVQLPTTSNNMYSYKIIAYYLDNNDDKIIIKSSQKYTGIKNSVHNVNVDTITIHFPEPDNQNNRNDYTCEQIDITFNSDHSFSIKPPPSAGPATATAAAAGSIPYSSFNMLASSFTSFTDKFTNCSANSFSSAILFGF